MKSPEVMELGTTMRIYSIQLTQVRNIIKLSLDFFFEFSIKNLTQQNQFNFDVFVMEFLVSIVV